MATNGMDVPFTDGEDNQEREYYYKRIIRHFPDLKDHPDVIYGNNKLVYLRLINEGLIAEVPDYDPQSLDDYVNTAINKSNLPSLVEGSVLAVRRLSESVKSYTDSEISRLGRIVESVKAVAGLSAKSPVDGQTSSLIEGPNTLTRISTQEAAYSSGSAVRSDSDHTTLQAAVNACSPGDTLEIRKTWQINSVIHVNKPMTIKCATNGSVVTAVDTHAFNITSNNVTLDGVEITGYGENTAGAQSLIRAVGTVASRIKNLTVKNCKITKAGKCGMDLHYVEDFSLINNDIRDIGYGAIMVLSGLNGNIVRNKIKNLTQAGSWVNSYGIALTRNSSQSVEDAPRTENVTVEANRVEGVTKWEGIDTHGGKNLTVIGNFVINCFIGIAMVPCPDANKIDREAPVDVIVKGNYINAIRTDGGARAGIQLVGAGESIGVVHEYGTGIIEGNIVINHGTQNSGTGSAIILYFTEGVAVKGNVIRDGSAAGICMYHSNNGTLIEGNTFTDMWSSSLAWSACIYFSSHDQSATIQGNVALRGTKQAPVINNRGIFISSSLKQENLKINYGMNNFDICTIPVVDSVVNQIVTEQRFEARRLGFYGVVPTPRTMLTYSRAGESPAETQLRQALAKLGLVGDQTTA